MHQLAHYSEVPLYTRLFANIIIAQVYSSPNCKQPVSRSRSLIRLVLAAIKRWHTDSMHVLITVRVELTTVLPLITRGTQYTEICTRWWCQLYNYPLFDIPLAGTYNHTSSLNRMVGGQMMCHDHLRTLHWYKNLQKELLHTCSEDCKEHRLRHLEGAWSTCFRDNKVNRMVLMS